jgi:hypothetical protein
MHRRTAILNRYGARGAALYSKESSCVQAYLTLGRSVLSMLSIHAIGHVV